MEEISRSNDEDVTARITAEMPYIPEAEFNGIVNNLHHQMESSSKNLEFERAAQLRDRIRELDEKRPEITKKEYEKTPLKSNCEKLFPPLKDAYPETPLALSDFKLIKTTHSWKSLAFIARCQIGKEYFSIFGARDLEDPLPKRPSKSFRIFGKTVLIGRRFSQTNRLLSTAG